MGRGKWTALLLGAAMPLLGFAQQVDPAPVNQGAWWSENKPDTRAGVAAGDAQATGAGVPAPGPTEAPVPPAGVGPEQVTPLADPSRGQAFDCVEVKRFETVTGFIQNKKDARAATIPVEKLVGIQSLVAGYIPEKLAQIKSTTAENGAPECPDPARAMVLSGKITDYKKGNQALRYFVGFGAGAQKFSVLARVTRKSDGVLLAEGDITDYKIGGWIGGQADKGQDDFAEKVVDFLKKSLADKR